MASVGPVESSVREVAFVKSSRSADTACVEVGFVKSSRSGATGDCVEVGRCGCGPTVYLRDSKDPAGPVLEFDPADWAAFLAGVRAGEFDSAGGRARG